MELRAVVLDFDARLALLLLQGCLLLSCLLALLVHVHLLRLLLLLLWSKTLTWCALRTLPRQRKTARLSILLCELLCANGTALCHGGVAGVAIRQAMELLLRPWLGLDARGTVLHTSLLVVSAILVPTACRSRRERRLRDARLWNRWRLGLRIPWHRCDISGAELCFPFLQKIC